MQERQLSERLELACGGVKDRLLSTIGMLHSSSCAPITGGVNAEMAALLEDERTARLGAEARAMDWERRLEVLKELVQVSDESLSFLPIINIALRALVQMVVASSAALSNEACRNVGASRHTVIVLINFRPTLQLLVFSQRLQLCR